LQGPRKTKEEGSKEPEERYPSDGDFGSFGSASTKIKLNEKGVDVLVVLKGLASFLTCV